MKESTKNLLILKINSKYVILCGKKAMMVPESSISDSAKMWSICPFMGPLFLKKVIQRDPCVLVIR